MRFGCVLRSETVLTRRVRLLLAGALVAALSACGGGEAASQAGRPPNFIVVLTDDQGYGDLGSYGARDIRTPNLDRMAGEGVRFTDFYVGAPVCTPSRAALLTGSYPKRAGMEKGVLWPDSPTGLHPDAITLAEILKAKGYATACIGKWHLGHLPAFLPTRQGFDAYFGVPYSNDMVPEHILSVLGADFPPLPLMRDEEVIDSGTDQNLLTKRYTEEALRFIHENRNAPFLVYLAHSMPHFPCHASEGFRDEEVTPEHRGIYASAVEEIDWSMGRILEGLEELGLDERTLVIFTSDNGPWRMAEAFYREPTGSAGPLRGWKGTVKEGGMRVPALMRWPGRLPGGAVCESLVTAMDILPTLAAYAGADLAEFPGGEVDGKDISGLLEQPDRPSPHEYLLYYDSDTGFLSAVRDAAGWKLHLKNDFLDVRELHYLPEDIHEDVNLFSRYPKEAARLREAARTFDREVTEGRGPAGVRVF
jgi:arylsulfatase A-like enzyme